MRKSKLPPLCSSSDVAKLLEIERTSIPGMIKRNKSFPDPVQIIGSGPIWLVEDIIRYKEKRDARLTKSIREGEL